MTISTYAGLQTAIASRMKRQDLAASIPDYIALAEVRIRALIDPHAYETTVTVVATPSSDTIALPTDFKNPVALWIADITPQQQLDQLLPETLPYSTVPTRPLYWCVDGSNIRFPNPCDSAYPFKLRYQQTFALSNTVTTNEVLQKYPDIYLYGSLVEAADDVRDNESQGKWNSRFMDAIQRCNDQEGSENKFVPLLTEFGQITRRPFNIYRGY